MIQLSDHFTYSKLLRFTFPSIVMMVFTSIYGVVDGIFVSNFVGKTAFAAVNLIYPLLMILSSIGFMFGTGGGALIGKTLGERRPEKANQIFSLIIYVSFLCGIVLSVLGLLFVRPIAQLLGAEGQLLADSVLYARVFLIGMPAGLLQFEFQSLFATANKPKLGLYFTVAAGLTNMALDALFVGAFHWGLVGAAAATVLSQCVGGIFPLFYFARENGSLLRLVKTHFDGRALLQTCSNGFSELLNNISMSIVSILYNFQLLKYAGEDGIAAYGVLMYVNFVFISMFIGYVVGTAPIISYHYGAQNHAELHGLLKKSIVILGITSFAMFVSAELLAKPLASIFVSYDAALLDMTLRAFLIYSFSFLFSGLGIMGSSFFTALNNGMVSALLSFLRTVVFQVTAVLVFPIFLQLDGIWLSIVFAECAAMIATFVTLIVKRKKYHY